MKKLLLLLMLYFYLDNIKSKKQDIYFTIQSVFGKQILYKYFITKLLFIHIKFTIIINSIIEIQIIKKCLYNALFDQL